MHKDTRKLKRAARKAGMPLKQFARERVLGPAWDTRKRQGFHTESPPQDNPNRPKPRPRINPMQLRPWFEVEGGFVR